MSGERRACDAVAAPAFVGIEIVERAELAAETFGERLDRGADPVGDGRCHATTQRRRGLEQHAVLVRQHDRLQPHQVLAAAVAGPVDVGNRRRNRDLFGQREPAG